MIDMHMHSTASVHAKDTYMLRLLARGATSLPTSSSIADKEAPELMMQTAFDKGLRAVALTDHWSVSALAPAQAKADELGIELIRGIEIGSLLEFDGNGYEVHLLAYLFDAEDPGLLRLCADAKRTCEQGAAAFLEGLRYLSIEITREDVEREYPGAFSSWAIRRMLVSRGYARNKVDASQIQQKAVVRTLATSPERDPLIQPGVIEAAQIIEVLHEAGASVFIAHPFWLTFPAQGGCPEELVWRHIHAVIDLGVDGIEAYSPSCTERQHEALLAFCRERGLPACGGSDSHSAAALSKSPSVGQELLESIKRHREGLAPWG